MLLALVVSLLVPGFSSPARADTQKTISEVYRQGYVGRTVTRFAAPNICVRSTFRGVITFRANRRTWKRSMENDTLYLYYIDRVKLTNNTLQMQTFKPSGSTCTSTPRNYVRLKATLRSRAYRCDYNQSISVSVPWSVGVSFWPSCGNRELAGWSGTDFDGGHAFRMARTNDAVKFNGIQDSGWRPSKRSNLTWNCAGVAAFISVTGKSATDARATSRVKACPTWNGSVAGW